MISVIDFGRGNLFSIGQALRHLDLGFEVTADPYRISRAGRIILPGVGAFKDAMDSLEKLNLIDPLKRRSEAGVPIVGICLGMQMLVSRSTEFGVHDGLDLIPGTVNRLDDLPGMRIPNVGWRTLSTKPEYHAGLGLAANPDVYFLHSYHVDLEDQNDKISTFDFGGRPTTAVIGRDNVLGFQFHPEKSGRAGLEILDGAFKTYFS